MLVGIDIGGTKTAVMVVNGKEMSTLIRPTTTQNLVADLHALIREATNGRKIQAIGIGIPGMVNRESGTVELASNLNILEPLALGELISAEFQTPALLENDVRIASLAVHAKYGVPNIAYLSIGTGVSAGIILDGKLWRGANGMAGEVGHLTVDADGTVFEQLVAGPAIARQAVEAGLRETTASDLFRVADEGNPEAQAIVERVCGEIGRMVQWLILTYDVEKVILGGGVAQIGAPFANHIFKAIAQVRLQSQLNYKMLPDDKIAVLPQGFNAGLYGAIELARSSVQT